MGKPIALVILVFLTLSVQGQEKTLKEQALEKFSAEQYDEAIALLEQAINATPDDAEVYYYLGWFNHYRAYDSRSLSGYDYTYSERIFRYLDKALQLRPDYGDAKYFYGAECSANAFWAMQNSDAKKLRYYYKLADEKGVYPPWLKEFGRNFLNGCDENAILFTGGNADFDVCMYLQLHENFRTDITLIPIGNIDRPWYVRFLKNGLKGAVKKVDLNLTDAQIMDIHPFKWEPTTVPIPVSGTDKREFGLPDSSRLQWLVNPDLFSDRMHSKIESETAKKRSYLSPQRAILLQVVEDNFSHRPVYFSNFCSPTLYGDLEVCFQNCGLVSRLTPVLTKDTEFEFNYKKIEAILQEENVINLSEYYYKIQNLEGLTQLKQLFSKQLKIGYNEEMETEMQTELEKKSNRK